MKRAGLERQLGYRTGIAVVRSAMSSMQALGDAGGAWLDLAIRFWLTKGFLIAATLSMAMHEPLTMAFKSPVSPTVDWLIASPLGATIATVCPILLLVGCCSRVASLRSCFRLWHCKAHKARRRCTCSGASCSAGSLSTGRARFPSTPCCHEVWSRLQSPVRASSSWRAMVWNESSGRSTPPTPRSSSCKPRPVYYRPFLPPCRSTRRPFSGGWA